MGVALVEHRIDRKHASILLYALQVASSNAKNAAEIVSSESIAELTCTEKGEEMAAEGATARPQQEQTLADLVLKEVAWQNPDLYEEYVLGQGLQRKQKKELTREPQGEGGTPPSPTQNRNAGEEELAGEWPLDEFGHPKPIWN